MTEYSTHEAEETQQLDIKTILSFENLTDNLDDNQLSKIGSQAKERFEKDILDNKDWRKDVKEIRAAAAQVSEEKTSPWIGAANVKYPLITTAALQFNARAYPTIINDSNIALIKVIGSDDGIPQMTPEGPMLGPEGQPIWLLPPGSKQKRSDRVSRYMNYQLTEEMEDWDAEMDQLLLALPIDGVAFKKTYWKNVGSQPVSPFINALDLVVDPDTKTLATCPRISQIFSLYFHEVKEKVMAGEYREPQMEEDQVEPEDFIEQHCRYDLDEDGYPEPYIVTFQRDTGFVVSIIPNYTPKEVLYQEDTIVEIKTIQYFTSYHCLPDPQGKFYSRGFGQLLKPINDSVDSILNQLIDAGSLANSGGGFIAKGFRIRSGTLTISPGKWTKVDVAGMPMKDAIMPYPIKDPSNVLFQLLGLLLEAGKDIASIQDVMTGSAGANTPATTVLSMIEQGMKVYTAIFRRVWRSMRQEMQKIYRLNGLYLTNEAYINILDEQASVENDFDTLNVNIRPAADPNMATDMQKAAQAQVLMGYIEFPFLSQEKIVMKSMRASGIAEPEEFLAPPPGPSSEELLEMGKLELLRRKEDRNDIEQDRKNYETQMKAGVDMATILEKLAVTDEKGADNVLNLQEMLFIMDIANETIRNGQRKIPAMEREQQMVLGPPQGTQGGF